MTDLDAPWLQLGPEVGHQGNANQLQIGCHTQGCIHDCCCNALLSCATRAVQRAYKGDPLKGEPSRGKLSFYIHPMKSLSEASPRLQERFRLVCLTVFSQTSLEEGIEQKLGASKPNEENRAEFKKVDSRKTTKEDG